MAADESDVLTDEQRKAVERGISFLLTIFKKAVKELDKEFEGKGLYGADERTLKLAGILGKIFGSVDSIRSHLQFNASEYQAFYNFVNSDQYLNLYQELAADEEKMQYAGAFIGTTALLDSRDERAPITLPSPLVYRAHVKAEEAIRKAEVAYQVGIEKLGDMHNERDNSLRYKLLHTKKYKDDTRTKIDDLQYKLSQLQQATDELKKDSGDITKVEVMTIGVNGTIDEARGRFGKAAKKRLTGEEKTDGRKKMDELLSSAAKDKSNSSEEDNTNSQSESPPTTPRSGRLGS